MSHVALLLAALSLVPLACTSRSDSEGYCDPDSDVNRISGLLPDDCIPYLLKQRPTMHLPDSLGGTTAQGRVTYAYYIIRSEKKISYQVVSISVKDKRDSTLIQCRWPIEKHRDDPLCRGKLQRYMPFLNEFARHVVFYDVQRIEAPDTFKTILLVNPNWPWSGSKYPADPPPNASSTDKYDYSPRKEDY